MPAAPRSPPRGCAPRSSAAEAAPRAGASSAAASKSPRTPRPPLRGACPRRSRGPRTACSPWRRSPCRRAGRAPRRRSSTPPPPSHPCASGRGARERQRPPGASERSPRDLLRRVWRTCLRTSLRRPRGRRAHPLRPRLLWRPRPSSALPRPSSARARSQHRPPPPSCGEVRSIGCRRLAPPRARRLWGPRPPPAPRRPPPSSPPAGTRVGGRPRCRRRRRGP
mmetsp:Transcript_112486/g.314322  ORF Transcript_112486/g.314322 Transcript_112486/m.314322 type:complete len:223 (+) Transcript_112486:4896-5564(+)